MSDLREFSFTDKHFEKLRKMVMEHTGISMSDAKRDLIYGRLARRLRKLGLNNFDDYLKILQQENTDELINFVNSVTTNLTAFFREEHHFDYLKSTLLPLLMSKRQQSRRIRIWSAGCSSGEEPYSIAMTIREAIPNLNNWDIKILATDIDTNILDKAKTGVYSAERVNDLDKGRRNRWFMQGKGEHSDDVMVKPELQEMITFKPLNLMVEWPLKGPIDILFCRNVVIYFDKATQRILFDRFAELLPEDGHMFVGHSESLYKVTDRFELLGKTIHRKVA
jgi:chemotaxis protein methyltransferase CheR